MKSSGSDPPPSFVSPLWNIGILLHKQATGQDKHICPECIKSYHGKTCWKILNDGRVIIDFLKTIGDKYF